MSLETILGMRLKDILIGDDGLDMVVGDKALELYCLDSNASPSKWLMSIDGEPAIINGEVLDKALLTRLLDREVESISIKDNVVEAVIGDYDVEIRCSTGWAWILGNNG